MVKRLAQLNAQYCHQIAYFICYFFIIYFNRFDILGYFLFSVVKNDVSVMLKNIDFKFELLSLIAMFNMPY